MEWWLNHVGQMAQSVQDYSKKMNQIHDCSEIEQSWILKEELREILEENLNEKELFFDGKELFLA